MKINFKNINFRYLLFLPLLTFVMAATNPCSGAHITIPGGGGDQESVNVTLDTQAEAARTIDITLPADSAITDLDVYATDTQTDQREQVDQITGLSPGEQRKVIVPKLKPEKLYKIELQDPVSGNVVGSVEMDTAYRVVYSNRSSENNLGFSPMLLGQGAILGGGSDEGGPYSQALLFLGGEIKPDFDIVLLKGAKANHNVQPAVQADFDGNGVTDFVIADPDFFDEPGGQADVGALYIIMNSIPTQDFEIANASKVIIGPNKNLRVGASNTYDPGTGYFITAVPGYSTNDLSCDSKEKCGACALIDAKNDFTFIKMIHEKEGKEDWRVCRYVSFCDLDRNGVKDLAYLMNSDVYGTNCKQLGVALNSITAVGTPIFTETVGDPNCDRGPLILQELDFNGDGYMDLSMTRFIIVPSLGWETYVWYAKTDFNPAVYDLKITGSGEAGGLWFLADMNNDQVDDLVNVTQYHVQIYWDADIGSTFDEIWRVPGASAIPFDVNGDGYADIFGCSADVLSNCRAFIMY